MKKSIKKAHPKVSRRLTADRKIVSQINVLNVKNINSGEVLFTRASVIDVSPTGLLLRVKRDEILAHKLRSTLTLSILHNESVGFTIEVMDTYIEGLITRTKAEGRGDFLAAVDFRDDAPDYWRQCFVDLLPEGDSEDMGGAGGSFREAAGGDELSVAGDGGGVDSGSDDDDDEDRN